METLHMQNTATEQWQTLIHEAENYCHTHLEEDLESYLVFLLMRYLGAVDIANSVLALEFLHSHTLSGQQRVDQLQIVGDKCLLYSGLFPGRAERQRVRISYYVGLGASAYSSLSDSLAGMNAELFEDLSSHFVALRDVLQATREVNQQEAALQPLQAMELWNDTGSPHALHTLSRYTQGTPMKTTALDYQNQFHIKGNRQQSH